jgi:hypothetical protein
LPPAVKKAVAKSNIVNHKNASWAIESRNSPRSARFLRVCQEKMYVKKMSDDRKCEWPRDGKRGKLLLPAAFACEKFHEVAKALKI